MFKLHLDYNLRTVNAVQNKVVDPVRSLEAELSQLTDNELTSRAINLRLKSASMQSKSVVIEALALACEASRRVLKQDPYDVQIVGAELLRHNNIIEMQTGEGKTLVAMLSAFMQSMFLPNIHIATVNEYLVLRDHEQMRPVFELLGTKCSCVVSSSRQEDRKEAYQAHVLYATSTELGFDYLRDNLCLDLKDQVTAGRHSIIVDEADSNMLDEAMTPLIISEPGQENYEGMIHAKKALEVLDAKKDVVIDFKERSVSIQDSGYNKIENYLVNSNAIASPSDLYSKDNSFLHYVQAFAKSKYLFFNGVDYIVKDKKVEIISDKTGRIMKGRRWSEGLHQALEAKEGLQIQPDSLTSASITLQHFYKMYGCLGGMTGTAATDAVELKAIYGVNIVVIPTNKPCIRIQHSDTMFVSKASKYQAIVADIQQRRAKNQPILVGTNSINDSEILSELLHKRKIPHQVLNAKYLKKEANIIAQAGVPGTVTVATNMAGRGTDIILGGNIKQELQNSKTLAQQEQLCKAQQQKAKAAIDAGGLYVLGAQRNQVRRIDNQLLGRCARQGDPGESRFYVSLEDELITNFTEKFNIESLEDDGSPIHMPWLSAMMHKAQKRIMRSNFSSRKQLAKDGDLLEEKRRLYSEVRQNIISGKACIDDIIAELNSISGSSLSPPTKTVRDQALERRIIVINLTRCWRELINIVSSEKKSLSLRAQCEQKDHASLMERKLNELFDNFLLEYRRDAIKNLKILWSLPQNENDKQNSTSRTLSQS